jgi:hypothetical protein
MTLHLSLIEHPQVRMLHIPLATSKCSSAAIGYIRNLVLELKTYFV